MPSFWKLFSLRSQSVKQASLLLAITALLSNVLGLLRNLIFYRLAEPGQLDAYYASFRISDFIFNLLIFGAISSAVIPVLSEMIAAKKEREAQEVLSGLLTLATFFFVILSVILFTTMHPLIHWVAPGFVGEKHDLTVELSRILLLQTVFFSWSFLVGALLNGYRRFATYSLAPLAYNSAIIIGGLLLPTFGVIGIAYAVVIGAFFHFLIQAREVTLAGFRYKPTFTWSKPIQEVARLMLPRSLSQGMGQLVLVVYTRLASRLQEGSLSIFSGINDLQTTPTVIIGNSLATAFFPSIAAHISQEEWSETNELFDKVLRACLFLMIPSVVLLFVLRAQIIRLYVGIGAFNWELTDIGIATLVSFLLGLIPAALVAILARVFYALKDTRTPMVISLFSGAFGIVTAYIGIQLLHYSVASLAVAESCIYLLQAGCYLTLLHRRAHLHVFTPVLLSGIWRYCLGSLLAGLSSWAILHLVDIVYQQSNSPLGTYHVTGLLLQTLLASVVGITVYFGYSSSVNKEELRWTNPRHFLKRT